MGASHAHGLDRDMTFQKIQNTSNQRRVTVHALHCFYFMRFNEQKTGLSQEQ